MTLVVTWPDRTQKGRRRRNALRRLALALRVWERRLARRRFVYRVAAKTRDRDVLADMGPAAGRPSHVERWIAAMLWHRR